MKQTIMRHIEDIRIIETIEELENRPEQRLFLRSYLSMMNGKMIFHPKTFVF